MDENRPPPLLGQKSCICWFFSILSRKSVFGSDSIGFVWNGVARALVQFRQFFVVLLWWHLW